MDAQMIQDSRLADTVFIADRITSSMQQSLGDSVLLSEDMSRIDRTSGFESNHDDEISIDPDLLTLKPLRCINQEGQ